MSNALRSASFKKLSPTQKGKAFVRALHSVQPVNSEKRTKELKKEIAALERRHGMKTSVMLRRLCTGQLADKGTIATWRRKYMLLCVHEENARA